ncbi:hypothetical protein MPSEU_000678600 [Mayamaea pseudoterrestris]|nr:hypothetical protein MPSEU_000678600 [Mayamaea pseudoterrestris]
MMSNKIIRAAATRRPAISVRRRLIAPRNALFKALSHWTLQGSSLNGHALRHVQRAHSAIPLQQTQQSEDVYLGIEDPVEEAMELIKTTDRIIQMLRGSSDDKVGEIQRNELSIDSIIKCWSKNSKKLEIVGGKESYAQSKNHTSESSNTNALLAESAETLDRLAKALFSFNNAHQVFATEVAITAWSRVRNNNEAASRAQKLFDAMPFEYGQAMSVQTPLFRARRRLYNALLLTWSRSSASDAPAQALRLLSKMNAEGTKQSIKLAGTRSYNYTMNAVAKVASESSINTALGLYKDMRSRKIYPDAASNDAIIKAYQTVGQDFPKAVEFFNNQLDQYRKANAPHPNSRPLNLTLRRVLSMCQNNPGQSRQILQRCLDFERECPECQGLVDLKSFLIAMQASSRKGDAEGANDLLMLLLSADHLKPNRKAYGIVMDANARRGTAEGLEKVKATLDAMERRMTEHGGEGFDIDSTVYNILLKAYYRTYHHNAVRPIEETIERMKQLARRFKKPQLEPDHISYTVLMQAIIQEGKPGFPHRVESVLKLIQSHSQYKDATLYSYTLAMTAWSKSNEPDAIDRIRKIFDTVKQPDVTCYNALLSAYAKQGLADEAKALLRHMDDEFVHGRNLSCCPDNYTYSTVLHALHKAEVKSWSAGLDVFDQMIQRYKQGENKCKPSETTVATLLQLLASSNASDLHYLEAMKVWITLEDISFEHGSYSVTAFIEACSETASDDPELLKAAFAAIAMALAKLGKRSTPLVYNAAFEACDKLIQTASERNQFLRDLFKLCASAGHVNSQVLFTLKRISPPDLYLDLTGTS